MKNKHESIHLSNVRLQMKYRKYRNPGVPKECMWDYRELQDHLRYKWYKTTYHAGLRGRDHINFSRKLLLGLIKIVPTS